MATEKRPHPQPAPSPWLSNLPSTAARGVQLATTVPPRADVVIIGAGMTGCALAYHLHKAGRSSLVLEARTLSAGASGRNGGILWPSQEEPFELRTTAALLDFVRTHHVDCGLVQNGGVSLVDAAAAPGEEAAQEGGPDREVLERQGEEEEELLEGLSLVDPCELLGAAPGVFKAAYRSSLPASFWPAKVVLALAQAASSATFVEQCHVDAIVDGEAGVTLHTSVGPVLCSQVAVATNGWIPRVLGELAPHMRACTNTVMRSREALPPELRWPVSALSCGDGPAEVYMSVQADGHLVVGGLRDTHPRDGRDDDDSLPGDAVIAAALRGWLLRRFPVHARALHFDDVWMGVLGFPEDGMPMIGEVPGRGRAGAGQLFVCGGFGGHGMPRCYGAAAALAQHMCGAEVEEAATFAAWNVSRFLASATGSLS